MRDTISRARTGCWTCRARRIKCDEGHPVCRRCARSNVSCGYGVRLIWHEESIARGVCHGRGFSSKKHDQRPETSEKGTALPASTREWMFLNTSLTDLEIYFNLPQDKKQKASPLPSLSTFPLESRSQYDPSLMTFFERIICSSSTLIDDALCNPYRYLILPMALASNGLYHAALAIAANTLRLSNPSYRLPALEHHHRALGHLQNLLAQEEWTERDLDEMTGLVLMLCWFQISDGSCPSWVTHLKGYQDLLRTRQNRPPRSSHSERLVGFFNRYFAFHLVLARTAFRIDKSVVQLPSMLAELNVLGVDADVIDPYMGLSHSLLLLINEVAQMAWSERSETGKDTLRLREKLAILQQIPPPGTDIGSDTECVAIAEANRLGALLLLQEVSTLSSKSRERNAQDQEEKNCCVAQILSLVLEKRASMMRTAVLPL
ncbi:fungal-specific transcription factor domain-containing protein [Aspergillus aurantiobrunneus]